MKIEFDQIIALVIVVGAFGLMASGIDGEMKSILTVAAGWAFGSGFQARKKMAPGKPPPASPPSE